MDCPWTLGLDRQRIQQLPSVVGLPATVVLADAASDTRWFAGVRLTGATLKLLGTADHPMTER